MMLKSSSNIFQNISNRYYGKRFGKKDFYSSKYAVNALTKTSVLSGHGGCVNAISFSRSGNFIVTGSDDSTVKIWKTHSKKCLETYYGHVSNVFATEFFYDNSIVSGGNDGDIRVYKPKGDICYVYKHHLRKVLNISLCDKINDSVFFSVSSDGTVRMFDTRKRYKNMVSEKLRKGDVIDNQRDQSPYEGIDGVIPQAMGGGRKGFNNIKDKYYDSLLIDYCDRNLTLYNIDFSPNGHDFIVCDSNGCVRLYDIRKINRKSPNSSINIFKDIYSSGEITGCSFSHDGSEVICSYLGGTIFSFDVNKNYSNEYKLDYTKRYKPKAIERINRVNIQENNLNFTPCDIELSSVISHIVNNDFMIINENHEDEESINLFINNNNNNNNNNEEDHIDVFYDENEDDIEDDEDDDDDDDEMSENETDLNDERLESPVDKTYKRKYDTHISIRTIKGVWYFGNQSEYIITGSDDKNIYIYETKSSKLVNVLEGHTGIVNTVVSHPYLPMILSSGIDSYVNVWTPKGSCNNIEEKEKEKEEKFKKIKEKNKKKKEEESRSNNGNGLMELLSMLLSQQMNHNDS